MTVEEVRLLKVGDLVWMLCRDEEPGTAVKCEVTKPANDYDVVTIKCVGNPKCEGHRPWYGDICKSEVEVYEKAISRAESSIEDSEQSIKNYQEDIKQNKANIENLKEKLAKAKEEEEKRKDKWLVDRRNGLVFSTPCVCEGEWFATQEEAYDALADYYRHKFIEASVKGTGGWLTIAKEHIVFLPQTWSPVSPKATFDRMGADMNGQVWRFNKSDLFRFRKEAEYSLKEKEGEAYAKAERRQV